MEEVPSPNVQLYCERVSGETALKLAVTVAQIVADGLSVVSILIMAVGCDALTGSEIVELHPLLSVTVSVGLYVLSWVNRKLGFFRLEVSPGFPVKFHSHLTAEAVVSEKDISIGASQAEP